MERVLRGSVSIRQGEGIEVFVTDTEEGGGNRHQLYSSSIYSSIAQIIAKSLQVTDKAFSFICTCYTFKEVA